MVEESPSERDELLRKSQKTAGIVPSCAGTVLDTPSYVGAAMTSSEQIKKLRLREVTSPRKYWKAAGLRSV